MEERRLAEAVPYFEPTLQLAPDKKEAITFLGLALQSQGDVKHAANDYRRALEIDPQYAPAKEELAEAERLMTTHPGQ